MASGTSSVAGSGHPPPSLNAASPSMSGRSRTSRPVRGTTAMRAPWRAIACTAGCRYRLGAKSSTVGWLASAAESSPDERCSDSTSSSL